METKVDTIEEVVKDIVNSVEQDQKIKEEAIKIDYKPAAEGNRQRPWCISNKIRTIGEFNDQFQTRVFIPLISLYETSPEKIPLEHWLKVIVKNKTFMVCKKTFLFMVNGICEPLYDKSNTVVTHIQVHSDEENGTDKNKEYWKDEFEKFMRCGNMSWEDAEKEYTQDIAPTEMKRQIADPKAAALVNIEEEFEDLSLGTIEQKDDK